MSDALGLGMEHDSTGDVQVAGKCRQGITNDVEKSRKSAQANAAMINALALIIGYENATRLFEKALREEKSIRQIMCEDRFLSTEQLDELLNLPVFTAGGQ
jgi:fumarate hydratase class II